MKKLIGTAVLLAAIIGTSCADTQKQPDGWQGRKVLVAYYSATGTTKAVAEKIAGLLGADLFAIEPSDPYSSGDLDWTNKSSRVCKEHDIIFGSKANGTATAADVGKLPVMLKSAAPDFARYDTVFIGYPIWWGQAPRIISTFLESYDFNGKTVVPFCTSGSSPIGSSATNLESLTPGADWLAGRRFSSGVSQSELTAWANELMQQ